MTDIEMLPLPDDVCDALQDWRDAAKPSITDATAIHGHIQDYARAVAEHNVKALQAELDNRWAQGVHTCHDKCQRIACVLRRDNKRLAEALRGMMLDSPGGHSCEEFHHYKSDRHMPGDDCPVQLRWNKAVTTAQSALRDHDQEGGNG